MVTKFKKNIITTIAGIVIYLYRDEIKEQITYTAESLVNKFISKITINRFNNHKLSYAINNELNLYGSQINKKIASDDYLQPKYHIANGSYRIQYKNKWIFIELTENIIELSMYSLAFDTIFLEEYLNHLYQKHSHSNNILIFYICEKNIWNNVIYRKPRNISNITNDMQNMLNDISDFFNSENFYKETDMPYRRGYLIIGREGTGKSTMVEKIAITHNMSIYMLNLNSNDITDSILIELVSKIPPKSLLIIDEFDKQYEAIQKNKNSIISSAGILNLLDGSLRLDHGIIVILIANSIDNLPNEFKESLLRKGRIDQIYTFTQKLT